MERKKGAFILDRWLCRSS